MMDLIVGASGDDDGGSSAGAAYVLFLTTAGLVTGGQKISNSLRIPPAHQNLHGGDQPTIKSNIIDDR